MGYLRLRLAGLMGDVEVFGGLEGIKKQGVEFKYQLNSFSSVNKRGDLIISYAYVELLLEDSSIPSLPNAIPSKLCYFLIPCLGSASANLRRCYGFIDNNSIVLH